MRIGIIGSGNIGSALTRRFTAAGHQVFVANSRGPQTLTKLAAETGAKPVNVKEAAHAGDAVVVTIPEKNISSLPADLRYFFRGWSRLRRRRRDHPRKKYLQSAGRFVQRRASERRRNRHGKLLSAAARRPDRRHRKRHVRESVGRAATGTSRDQDI